MSSVSEVFGELRNVFAKYIPWHSEAEMTNALLKIDTVIAEAEAFEKTVAPQVESVVNPTNPAVSTAVPAPAATATENPTTPDVQPGAAPATTVSTAVASAATDPYSGPLFPGSYTPPPAG
jgi:hypothetical protein